MAATRKVLAQLNKRHKLGLVSSGDRDRVSRQLREFRLTRVFRTRVLGGDTKEKKPHPAPLLKALKEMKADPRNCVYVGDTPDDVEMARAAGVRALPGLGAVSTQKRLRAGKAAGLFKGVGELPGVFREL